MKTYLVGGAVRDKLLDLPVTDRDWVVVGSTPEQMLAQDFRPVGKDFPVFLHPETNEEYALARTERKTAPGYTGFEFHAAPDVTLEQDLERRDLTINAMAMDDNGQLIDPFDGADDLHNGLLRHVSPAFAEDPVRILRIARFAARFARWGFRIAHDTHALMLNMVEAGEVDALVAERVWTETVKALAEPNPERFFEVLRGCGALERIFPEIDRLFGVPQPARHHPEIDTGVHVMMVLQQSVRLSDDTRVRFAALVHDLGKGTTPKDQWPRHIAHEHRSARLVRELCERLKVPKEFRDLGIITAEYHSHCHRALELKPATLLKLLEATDAFRRPQRFEQFLLACEADARGRTGLEERDYPQADCLRAALEAASAVDARPFAGQGLKGEQIAEAIREERLHRIKALTRGPG
jgi:tRNA nucleotidyltransferase (CCA-adding enzyme)